MSKIYKISNSVGLCYIGSTTQKYLSRRLSCHKYHFKKWQKGQNNYISSFEVIQGSNIKIELLEEVKEKTQLLIRERFYIDNLNCVNKNKPTRTAKEWCTINKNHHRQLINNWRIKNKDKINFRLRQTNINNKFNNLINQLENFIKSK